MPEKPLSELCRLMGPPDSAPEPTTVTQRPADCPKNASYIKSVGGGKTTLPGNAPFPLVFEGGDGDDSVTVIGQGKAGVLVYGGKGNDSLVVESNWTWLARELGGTGLLILGLVTVALLAAITWRALQADK